MSLELQTTFQVGTIRVANLDLLKAELEKELQYFKQIVVSKENMSELRNARARLNKASEAFNKRRLELSRAYNEPFLAFKSDVDGIIEQIGTVLKPIDEHIKNFESDDRIKREQEIRNYYTSKYSNPIVPLERIFDEKWLNYGMTIEKVVRAILEKVTEIENNLALIDQMTADKPTLRNQVKTEYLLTLDLKTAFDEVNKRNEIAGKIDTHNANAVAGDLTITFKVSGSKEKLMLLSKFLKENGYAYERMQ